MPYGLTFHKPIETQDTEHYINECCFGGDAVSDRLMPEIEPRYEHVRANQEDWGWFIWFRSGKTALAVDIFCHDVESGEFRIHLTTRRRRRLLPAVVEDTPELEELRELVVGRLEGWVEGSVQVEKLDANYA